MVSKNLIPQRESSSYQKIERIRYHQPKHVSTLQSQQFVLRSIATVYTGNPTQAATLHGLFESVDVRILAEDSLARIAQRICENWEPAQLNPDRLAAFIRFLKFIVGHTNIPGEIHSLEEAIKMCANRHSAFPTVHAPLVLLLALGYLERLTLRYRNAKGESGCAQRLFLMAYTIAAKYLHANLAASTPLLRNRSESPLLNRVGTSSAFQVHPSQFTRPSSPALSPPQSPRITPLIPSQSLMIMTATTNYLARLMPSVSARELYRMEMEFLVFMENGVQVQKIEEAEAWKDIYVMQGKIRIKREHDHDHDHDHDHGHGHDLDERDHDHNVRRLKSIKLEPQEENNVFAVVKKE